MTDYELEGFRLLEKIGEGTYGDVYKVEDVRDNRVYAIKFIRFRDSSLNNGVSVSTIREIRFLKSTNHNNIVKLYDIVSPEITLKMSYNELKPICMIMDYVDHDMWGLLQLAKESKLPIYAEIHVKWYMFQLLNALDYLHKNQIIHRDLKTSNLLVTNDHIIKLTDFGLARKLQYGEDRQYTNNVMTLWYRPPELLLGVTHYGTEADIWSAGCIFGELLTGSPIFPTRSEDEIEELGVIFKACGNPKDSSIQDLLRKKGVNFPDYPDNLKGCLQQKAEAGKICKASWIKEDVMSLLLEMLQIVPSKRKTAEELLRHPYFDEIRDHAPDLPPYSLSLNTHRFQVKTLPPIQKTESITRQKSLKGKTNDIQSMFQNLTIQVSTKEQSEVKEVEEEEKKDRERRKDNEKKRDDRKDDRRNDRRDDRKDDRRNDRRDDKRDYRRDRDRSYDRRDRDRSYERRDDRKDRSYDRRDRDRSYDRRDRRDRSYDRRDRRDRSYDRRDRSFDRRDRDRRDRSYDRRDRSYDRRDRSNDRRDRSYDRRDYHKSRSRSTSRDYNRRYSRDRDYSSKKYSNNSSRQKTFDDRDDFVNSRSYQRRSRSSRRY